MRNAILAIAAVSCLAIPASAQEREARLAEALNDPAVQEGITAAVSVLAAIVLDTRVGSLAPYADGVRPGDTLRDLKRREDPDFERRLRRDTRRAVGTAGQVAGDLATTTGAIAETTARLQAALAPLAAALNAGRDHYLPDDD